MSPTFLDLSSHRRLWFSPLPELGRSPGEGDGNPLQYSCLENSIVRGAWQAIVHSAAKSWTWLKQLSTQAHKHKNAKGLGFPGGTGGKEPLLPMQVMSETWVWSLGREDPPGIGNDNPLQYSCLENPRTEESGGLQCSGLQIVGHAYIHSSWLQAFEGRFLSEDGDAVFNQCHGGYTHQYAMTIHQTVSLWTVSQ